ncbi:MAG TPA: DEAD/DEAH box helicase [Thermoanaerobaculia bacterium]|nr:DEAD/DEAH box helicase [Thermoanaerobaculia bacterium]
MNSTTYPTALDFGALVADLEADPRLGARIVHAAELPAVPARYGALEPPLPEPLRQALARGGVSRLWSHQAEAIAAVRRGENVLVTTPTASGKSLVFQVPPIEEALAGGPGRALFLFPLKALGQDQRGKFRDLAAACGLTPEEAGCEIYDGDTSPNDRAAIRRRFPRVLITNPDMLHLGILAHWTSWGPFLADLRWIVLDELHTYRGIFGSHFHHTLSRLLRLARALGADPQVIASSATAGNAAEFAQALAGRPFHWVEEAGAPREGRRFLLLQPEVSPYTSALNLFVELLKRGAKTIVFTKARRITELLYSWLRKREPDLARRVSAYRSGFLPEERRRIEGELFAGRLDGVIATSALEMGIDIGGLDACVLVGYPGSVMSTWQRSGRAGRSGRESLTAMIALPDALDQYFLAHPEQLLGRPCERLVVDPSNAPVSRAHLLCAASELPLERGPDAAYLAPHAATIESMLARGELFLGEGGELFSLRQRPQRLVSLRGSGESYAIEDTEAGRTIGTIDGIRALRECHPGAVYLHAGRQYLVKELNGEERRVLAEPADVDWFTTALMSKETEILEVLAERTDGAAGRLVATLGRLKVTERVVGYERRRVGTLERLDRHELDFPPIHFETVGLWWRAPRPFEEALRRLGEDFMGALHASEHAAISLFPLLAICDRNDMGGISTPFHPQVGCGAVFLYDGHPGGVGITAKGFENLPDLLGRVLDLLTECPCESGCPSCVQSPKCGNGNRPLDKAGAARVVRLLLEREELSEEDVAAAGARAAADAAEAMPVVGEPEGWWAGEETSTARRMRGFLAPAVKEPPPPVLPPQGGEGPFGERGSRRRPSRGSEGGRKDSLARFEALPKPPSGPARTILFDLETLRSAAEVGGWNRADRMGVAVGVLYFLEEDRFESYREDRVGDLVEALRSATQVVGFNSRRFDYKVLEGYAGRGLSRELPTLDLLEEVRRVAGFRMKLDHLAQETLGAAKSADGLQSLAWVAEGRFDEVEEYCRHDVEILRDLFLFGRREGYLMFRDKRRDVRLRLPVSW